MCQKLPHCARNPDPCLKDILKKINDDPRLKTLSCCCGHEKYDPTIVVMHKKSEVVYELHSQIYLGVGQRAGNRYYKKDGKAKRDHYYIPEVRDQISTILVNMVPKAKVI